MTSSPEGINCGTDCQESYTNGTVVTLTATADSDSTFEGWSGDGDCTDGQVTMNADTTCTATFTSVASIPVVLVHGWCSDPSSAFGPFGEGNSLPELLEQEGFTVALANYSDQPCQEKWCIEESPCEDCDEKTIGALAVRLAVQIALIRQQFGVSQVDVIAHSMGGLIARAYIAGLARDRLVRTPYTGQIRRLIMAGTPNYGAAAADLSFLSPGCSQTQAQQLEMGSLFLWKLHGAWEAVTDPPDTLVIAGTIGDLTPFGDPVDGNDDGLVNIYSVALMAGPEDRARYVPYNHSSSIPFPEDIRTLVNVDGPDHATFRLVQPFLQTGTVLPQCCGEGTVDYQPSEAALNRGMLVLQLINEKGRLHRDIELVSVEFSPSAEWDNRDNNNDGGSLTLIGVHPPGVYDITVEDPVRQGSSEDVAITGARTTLRVIDTAPIPPSTSRGVGTQLTD